MEKFTEHITTEGERWDNIAFRAYGDASALVRIIDANPSVAIHDVLPGGIRLRIPVISRATVTTETAKLPPWKR